MLVAVSGVCVANFFLNCFFNKHVSHGKLCLGDLLEMTPDLDTEALNSVISPSKKQRNLAYVGSAFNSLPERGLLRKARKPGGIPVSDLLPPDSPSRALR